MVISSVTSCDSSCSSVAVIGGVLGGYSKARSILLICIFYDKTFQLLHRLFFKGKGLRSDVTNYRPLSLSPVLSKVLDHIVKGKLIAFISANRLQDPNQHGFVSKRSVVSNLLISGSILTKSLDRNIPVDMILFDFSKAFDSVPHSLLLHRLK